MAKIFYGILIHFCVNYIELRTEKIKECIKEIIEECIKEIIKEQICEPTDMLAFPECTTKYESEIFPINKPEIVSKTFRFNVKAAINDFVKYLAIALKDSGDLYIYERTKKNDMYPCHNLLKYGRKRYFCYKNGNGQLFIRKKDSFHKKRKLCPVAQNSILSSKFNSSIKKWLYSEKTAQSVALMCS